MTDVRPEEPVEFNWQTVSARGFVIVEVLVKWIYVYPFGRDVDQAGF